MSLIRARPYGGDAGSRKGKKEAAAAGFYQSAKMGHVYPRIQILTMRELLAGAGVKMPTAVQTFKRAERVREPDAEQKTLFG